MFVRVLIIISMFCVPCLCADTKDDISYLKNEIAMLQEKVKTLEEIHNKPQKVPVVHKKKPASVVKKSNVKKIKNVYGREFGSSFGSGFGNVFRSSKPQFARINESAVNDNVSVPKIENVENKKFNVSGFINMIVLHDFNLIGYNFNRDYTYVPQIKYKDDEDFKQRKSTRMHVKQSRIVMTYKNDAKFWGEIHPVMIFLDIDFYNGNEGNGIFTHSFQPRMRNACVDVGGLKVGLFWTLFMDQANFPVTIDFGSDTGLSLLRQPQIRYTHKVNNIWSVAGSIENSDSTFVEKDGISKCSRTLDKNVGDLRSTSIFPDFIVALLYNHNGWNGGFKGVLNTIRVSQDSSKRANSYGFGFGASSSYVFSNKDKIIAHFNVGNGIGRYLHDGAQYGYYYNKDTNKLYRHFAFGYTLGFTHYWVKNVHSSVSFGQTRIELNKEILDQDLKKSPSAEENFFKYCTSFHMNLIWNITSDIELGLEYLRLVKAPVKFTAPLKTNRENGTLNRILFSFKVNFN